MDPADFFVNTAYVLYVGAPLLRQPLKMRTALLVGALFFAVWGYVIENPPTIFWNLLFAVISSIQIYRIWHDQRPVDMDDEMTLVRDRLFPLLASPQFAMLWHMGTERTVRDETLIADGAQGERLILVLDGALEVERDGGVVASLGPMSFAGEMSLISQGRTTGRVLVDGESRIREWSHAELQALRDLEPRVFVPLMEALAADVSAKLGATA